MNLLERWTGVEDGINGFCNGVGLGPVTRGGRLFGSVTTEVEVSSAILLPSTEKEKQ